MQRFFVSLLAFLITLNAATAVIGDAVDVLVHRGATHEGANPSAVAETLAMADEPDGSRTGDAHEAAGGCDHAHAHQCFVSVPASFSPHFALTAEVYSEGARARFTSLPWPTPDRPPMDAPFESAGRHHLDRMQS